MTHRHGYLTSMQEGMLFHSVAAPQSGVNIEQIELDLPEPIDAPALRRAWEWVVARHPMLRVAFTSDAAGQTEQRLSLSVGAFWSEEDLRTLPHDRQDAHLAAWRRMDRARGFELEKSPLLRVMVHRLDEHHFRLTWTFHHALLDGRSYAKVLEEVFAAYEAFRLGTTPSLPPPVSLATYFDWRAEQNFSASTAFWQNELKGFSAPTPLLAERTSRTSAEVGSQRDDEISLAPETTAQLRAFAASHGFTLCTVVQGAWALLLARYSTEEEVVFGGIRACRKSTVAQADDMVGLFINAVPLRVRCMPDTILTDFLRAIRARWVAMRPHEHTPLTLSRAASDVPPEQPLFESLVVFEHQTLQDRLRALGGAWARRSVRLYEQTNFALTLAAYGGAALSLRLQFDPARFSDATIARMLGHLRTLLAAMPCHASAKITDLPLLTGDERRELLVNRNTPLLHFARGSTLSELFEQQVARSPDRIAVTCGDETLTYAALNRRANHVAHRLRALGVGPEKKVGLFVERSLDLVAGLIGILKAGGAYVPLDSAYPTDRLTFMIDDAGLTAIVTQSNFKNRFAARATPVICVDDTADFPPASFDANPASDVAAENLAYVIYTSGSTGKPKGVLVTHANVVRLFQATAAWFHFSADDVWTLFHSCAFDFSVWELWGALLHGGKLVIVPYLISRSPESFYALLERERVTVLNQTPSAFRQLVEVDGRSPAPRLALRYVIFGGEALEVGSLRPWFDRHGDEQPRLINMYGITETTVHVTYRPITRADLAGGSVIGARIPDLQLYILDPRQQPVPIGVAGELYVGGDGVARGYLNRPELTAERFVVLPAVTNSTARLYRTGDRVRYLANGDIEYLGRLDLQVKIRGHRVELGEIEAALCQHEKIRAAVIVALSDGTAGQRLVAYVVRSAEAVSPTTLRDHLARRLPHYMIPATFVWLDRLPLTANGKVDRRALPAPDLHRPDVSASFVAPNSPTEKRLAEIWRDVLRLDRVGVQDNFFELGGNSLLLVQLLARIRREFPGPLEIAELFKFPTVQTLAAHLDRAPQIPSQPAAAPGARLNDVVRRAQRQAAALQRRTPAA